MVARITSASERHAAVRGDALAIAAAADELRDRFMAARPVDEAAYGHVVEASAMPRATESEKQARTQAMQRALAGAAEAPLVAAGLCAEGMQLARRAEALGNSHLASDVECAIHFFRAALAASIANVRINHRFLRDRELVVSQEERLIAIVDAAEGGRRLGA